MSNLTFHKTMHVGTRIKGNRHLCISSCPTDGPTLCPCTSSLSSSPEDKVLLCFRLGIGMKFLATYLERSRPSMERK